MDLIESVYLEVDVPVCSNTFGVSPCTATGSEKCFNTRNSTCDCQDVSNFTESTQTYRFGLSNGVINSNIIAYHNIDSLGQKGGQVLPGEQISTQSSCSVTFKNNTTNDAKTDPYLSDRSYDASEQGTFWGKFFARNPYLYSVDAAVYRGDSSMTSLSSYEKFNYIVDSWTTDSNGNVNLKLTDFMRLLYGKRSLAPAQSKGELASLISNSVVTATLSPTDIGDDDYPASGKLAIGQEICSFTRSGDVLTITRGEDDTEAKEHKAGEAVQVVLEYSSESIAEIVDDLVVNYTPLDASYTDLTAWNAIVSANSDVLYSRIIPKPTPVSDLLNELCVQGAMLLYQDIENEELVFDLLRDKDFTSAQVITESVMIGGSYMSSATEGKRVSEVLIRYGVKDYFKNLSDKGNFHSALLNVVSEDLYAQRATRQINSAWIPVEGRSIAESSSNLIKSRYKHPPSKITFVLAIGNTLEVGEVFILRHRSNENCFGEVVDVSCIVTRSTRQTTGFRIEAESYQFDNSEILGKTINLADDSKNINLRTLYDTLYASVDEVNDIVFTISSGEQVGSSTTATPAITRGTWPAGATLVLENLGTIVGKGGGGGESADGGAGGIAIDVTSGAITIDNQGIIGGGGGGGGGSDLLVSPFTQYRGGGGAGFEVGPGDPSGTLTAGGDSVSAGDGGDLGQAGTAESSGPLTHYNGGAAGAAVDGESNVTYTTVGDIRGSRIN